VSARFHSIALFVLALVPRAALAIDWTREPVWDGHYYDIGARSIAAGLGYVGTSGGAWCHYPVGYSGLLGLAYKLAGDAPAVGPMLNALLGAGTAVLVYLLARTVTSQRRALIAGVLFALYPGAVAYTPLLMSEPTATFGLVAGAYVAARWGDHRWGLVASGILLGLTTLVRPQTLLCTPFVGLLLPSFQRAPSLNLKGLVRSGTLATLVSLVTISPWTLRNCVVMDGCALVSTNGGWNLAIGAFPRATGRFATLRANDGCHIVTGQVQQDRCWMQLGRDWIAADPKRWLGLIDDKLGFTFDHESFPVGYLAEAAPSRWPETHKALGRAGLSWSYRVVLLLAALALAPRPTRKQPSTLLAPFLLALFALYAATTPTHPFWPVALAIPLVASWRHQILRRRGALLFAAAAVATVAATHAVFFGEDRYHMVVVPLLCLLAACVFDRDVATTAPSE